MKQEPCLDSRCMWQQWFVGVFLSGQGSAVQAAGAESQRNPTEDLQRADRLDWTQDARQTQSALILTVLYILCVCLCSNMLQLSSVCLVCWLFSPSLSCSSIFYSFPLCFIFLLILFLSVVISSCLSFSSCFLSVSWHVHVLSLTISRCRGPLCEHDSTDQRSPPLLFLGGRQETLLHRQRQHGLEIPGHSSNNPPHITAHTQNHTYSHFAHNHAHTHLNICILTQKQRL